MAFKVLLSCYMPEKGITFYLGGRVGAFRGKKLSGLK
jgi:hypothetical protein